MASPNYFAAARHPLPCLMFMLPMLAAYEIGIYLLGGPSASAVRNGADAWLRWLLDSYGLRPFIAAPILIIIVFAIWSVWRWDDHPSDTIGLICGMWFESVLYAFGIWAIGHNFSALLQAADVRLAVAEVSLPTTALAQIVTFVGAGIYEELLFRLVLISGLVGVLRYAFVPAVVAVPVTILGSALLFAAAHHFGEAGEPMDAYRFIYRTTAGIYFAVLYWFRGFGIAVGTHVLYDVLVGVRVE